MSNAVVRHPQTQVVHEIIGSAPGWALCDAWLPPVAPLDSAAEVSCPGCRKTASIAAAARGTQ